MAHAETTSPQSGPRFARFSLATLFVVVTVIAIALAVALEMNTANVTAYVLVAREPADWLPEPDGRMTDEEYRLFRRTQVEYMRSEPLLIRALRNPAVSSLPLVQGQADPVTWLQRNLKFDYPGDAEILRIRLRSRQVDQAAKLVNAVVDAYFNDVVERQIQERARAEQRLKDLYQERCNQIVNAKTEVEKLILHAADGGSTPEIEMKQADLQRLEAHAGKMHEQLLRMHLEKNAPPRVRRIEEATIRK